MHMVDFEFIEHTADLGLRVYGSTIETLFKNYANVLFSLLTDHCPENIITKKITFKSQTLAELLADWLNELLSMFFADQFLPGKYRLKITDDKGGKILTAEVEGAVFDPEKIELKREIKAATYHELKIEETDGGYAGEVIFDI